MNEKTLSRRSVLQSSPAVAGAVIGMAGGQLVTCGSSGIQINPAILTAIQTAVAEGCNFIPTVESVVALIAVMFPALSGVSTISSSVLAEISATLCAAAPTPTAAGKLGGAASGVPVHGYIVGPDGKLVYA